MRVLFVCFDNGGLLFALAWQLFVCNGGTIDSRLLCEASRFASIDFVQALAFRAKDGNVHRDLIQGSNGLNIIPCPLAVLSATVI